MTKAMVTINPGNQHGRAGGGLLPVWLAGRAYNRWPGINCLIFSFFCGVRLLCRSQNGLFSVWCWPLFSVTSAAVQHGIHAGGEWIAFPQARWVPVSWSSTVRLIPTGSYQVPNNTAPVPGLRIHHVPQALYSTAISTASMPGDGTAGGCLCPLSDRDVWSAGRRSGDVFRRAQRTSSGCRRYCCLSRSPRFCNGKRSLEFLGLCSRAAAVPPARHFDRYQPVRRDARQSIHAFPRQARSTML